MNWFSRGPSLGSLGGASAAPAESGANDGPAAPFVIGLTGPIGCGKSTVASILRDLGATVIDADVLAREATAPGEQTLPAIRSRFGDGVFLPDATLDRAALAARVFSDAGALRDLEAILHPAVRRRVLDRLERAAAAGDPIVVIEAIKLVEGGLAERCDEVWLITCEAVPQRRRLVARGMHAADIERRVATQGGDIATRLAGAATRTLDTSGSLEATRSNVEDALAEALAPILLG